MLKKMQESNIFYGRKFCRNFGRNHCFFAQKNRPQEDSLGASPTTAGVAVVGRLERFCNMEKVL
jgi:hypothetical protein